MSQKLKLSKKNSFLLLLGLCVALGTSAQAEESLNSGIEKFHAAVEKCAKEQGLPGPSSKKGPPDLTDEQKDKLDTCLKKEGVKPPKEDRKPKNPR